MSNKIAGRLYNEPETRTSQRTSGHPKMIGRVNNELDKHFDLETASHKKEIGVVNNEIKLALNDRETHASPLQIIGRIHNEYKPNDRP